MPRIRGRYLLLLVFILLAWPLLTSALNITPPDPVIKIPGLSNLSKIDEKPCPDLEKKLGATGCLYIPWIGEYVGGLYKFAVLASTILATVVLMIAGFMWLTAGGNVNQIGTAKSYIGGAVMGLVLMMGSYTILNLINPDLVAFNSLRIPVIKRVNLRDYVIQLYSSGTVIANCLGANTLSGSSGLIGSDNETYFNNAGNEFGISAIYLASIAAQETGGGFKTDLTSPKGAFGIMQIMPKTASDIWNNNKNIARPPECSGDDDPASGAYTPTCKNWMKSNPQEVIRMGAAYFQTINNQLYKCGFSGNTTLMAAGYNAGPYRRDICGGELPPIQETQDYVRKVNSYSSSFCKSSGGTVEKIDTTPPGLEPAPAR